MNQPENDPVTIDPDTVSKAAQAGTFFHAWMEDSDQWDGWAMFTDLRTAMEITAAHYADDDYPFRNDPEEPGDGPGELTWTRDHGSWHLTDAGRDTMIRLTRTIVYGPAAQGPQPALCRAPHPIVAEAVCGLPDGHSERFHASETGTWPAVLFPPLGSTAPTAGDAR